MIIRSDAAYPRRLARNDIDSVRPIVCTAAAVYHTTSTVRHMHTAVGAAACRCERVGSGGDSRHRYQSEQFAAQVTAHRGYHHASQKERRPRLTWRPGAVECGRTHRALQRSPHTPRHARPLERQLRHTGSSFIRRSARKQRSGRGIGSAEEVWREGGRPLTGGGLDRVQRSQGEGVAGLRSTAAVTTQACAT